MTSTATLSNEEKQSQGIIFPGMKDQFILNTYRDLRNKLQRISDYQNFVCLISSLGEDGDASLLAMNLGAVFAFDRNRSALIIDCDPKWGLLDELCAREDEFGLVDFIENDVQDLSSLIYESGIDRLRIVPSGRLTDTRTESLESTRMREIVLELKRRYEDRYIFINAPSMKLSSEVQILANVSDMVLFELVSHTTTKEKVTDAIEMLGAEKIAGIVFRNQ